MTIPRPHGDVHAPAASPELTRMALAGADAPIRYLMHGRAVDRRMALQCFVG